MHIVDANADGCSTNGVILNVAAAPDIAPYVTEAAAKWQHTSPAVGGHCVSVSVTAVAPAQTALALLAGTGGTLSTGALPSPAATAAVAPSASASIKPTAPALPAVWIPDSSSWLDRVSGQVADVFTGQSPSLASSPVVVGIEQADAAKLKMTKGVVSSDDFKAAVKSMRDGDLSGAPGTPKSFFQLGLTEPRQDAAGLAGAMLLAGLDSGADASDSQYADLVADYRIASPSANQATDATGIINAFTTTDKTKNAIGLRMTAAILSEQSILAYDATGPAKPLEAVRLDQGLGALNYPIALTSNMAGQVADAATLFQTAMLSPAYRGIYAAGGFRTPDGAAATGFPSDHGAISEPAHIQPILGDNNAGSVMAVWAAANTASRVLVLLDVSSTMGNAVPRSGTTRMGVTQGAALTGLALFTPDSMLGSWLFAPGLGPKDYKEDVPVAALNAHNGAQANAIGQSIQLASPGSQSGCGLYPAVDAAYRNMLDNYAVGRINTVVVFTDCASQAQGGMSLKSLTTDLQNLADVNRPVPLVLINVGTSEINTNLQAIANSVGGKPYPLTAPSEIVNVFLKALVAVGS